MTCVANGPGARWNNVTCHILPAGVKCGSDESQQLQTCRDEPEPGQTRVQSQDMPRKLPDCNRQQAHGMPDNRTAGGRQVQYADDSHCNTTHPGRCIAPGQDSL